MYYYCAGSIKKRMATRTVKVSWTKPASYWFKLNTDGFSLGNPGRARGGGLARNDREMWIASFTRNIGKATSVEAELWALRDGFFLCKTLNLEAIEIELDAKVVFDWVGGILCSNSAHAALILDSRFLLYQFK